MSDTVSGWVGHTCSVDGYDASTYGERFAEVYDSWYPDVSDVEGTVARIADLAAGAPVLELGIGTGRLALPLAAQGVTVHGVDASQAMVDALIAKPGGAAIPVWIGDMAALAPEELVGPTAYGVAFSAYNTFFNVTSASGQTSCAHRCADRLAPGGHLVLECFVPTDEPPKKEASLDVRTMAVDQVVLSVTERDPEAQTLSGQHVEISEAGIRLRPWKVRYLSPSQLDALMMTAGLTLVDRSAGWRGEPFHLEESVRHVSTYQKR